MVGTPDHGLTHYDVGIDLNLTCDRARRLFHRSFCFSRLEASWHRTGCAGRPGDMAAVLGVIPTSQSPGSRLFVGAVGDLPWCTT